MKIISIFTVACTAFTFAMVSCNDKKEVVTNDNDSSRKPVPHDHDGDGVPDHGPGEHNHDNDHGHDHPPKVAGPNGGKVLTAPNFKIEFLVTDDRKIRVTFLDEENAPKAAETQEVTLSGGNTHNLTSLTFSKTEDSMTFVSSGPLPQGNNFPAVLSVKVSPDAEPARARFFVNLDECSECKLKKYACICNDHEH